MSELALSSSVQASLIAICEQRGLSPDELISFWIRTSRVPSKSQPYGLNDTIRFGRLQGSRVETVIRADPSYVAWCLENLEHFVLQPEAERLFRQIQKGMGYVDLPADEGEYRNPGPQEMDPAIRVQDRKTVRWHEQNYPPPPVADIEVQDAPPQTWPRKGVPVGTYRIHRQVHIHGIGDNTRTYERRLYIKARKHWVRCGKTLEKAVLDGE